MTRRTSHILDLTGALVRRLVVVALFLFGFGEAPAGIGEGSLAREALAASRAVELTAGQQPGERLEIAETERAKPEFATLGGGEDDRAAASAARADDLAERPAVRAAGSPPLHETPRPHFQPRAPPANA